MALNPETGLNEAAVIKFEQALMALCGPDFDNDYSDERDFQESIGRHVLQAYINMDGNKFSPTNIDVVATSMADVLEQVH